jgi:nucleoside 2-deoxyribosyltransferase
MSQSQDPFQIYFAGELFSTKHLLGNLALAQCIERLSEGRHRCYLPQDLEQRDTTPRAIRDQDIRVLWSCDLAIFNYDGPELDSGTVVEFMLAKAADIPSVLLRTDFRGGGDQGTGQDAWNLMSSFYPRTRSLQVNAMALYKEARAAGDASAMIETVAHEVLTALEAVLNEPPALPEHLAEPVYQWLAKLPGFTASAEEMANELATNLARKRARGLL